MGYTYEIVRNGEKITLTHEEVTQMFEQRFEAMCETELETELDFFCTEGTNECTYISNHIKDVLKDYVYERMDGGTVWTELARRYVVKLAKEYREHKAQ